MYINTRNNDQLLRQHPSVGTNSYGHDAYNNKWFILYAFISYTQFRAPEPKSGWQILKH